MGDVPITVVMITLNEAHSLEGALRNVAGWAERVIIVDSNSRDATVDIALGYGAEVVQRKFTGFGDQWNFALSLSTTSPWTMKMDPDERVSPQLKQFISARLPTATEAGFTFNLRLWFMDRPMPVSYPMLRLWRAGACRFTKAQMNEHPVVDGPLGHIDADLEYHDSPNLEHWLYKQNKYTTAEAIAAIHAGADGGLRAMTRTQQLLRHWFYRVPGRYQLYFLYCLLYRGAWRAGRIGWMWSHLRSEVLRLREYKIYELKLASQRAPSIVFGAGEPDPRVPQY
jgi:glycosyltransferase involved in cell wall biosynthesis